MKKIHNIKNLILCIVLIGALCASILTGGVYAFADESSASGGVSVAAGLVDATETDATMEGETSIIKDEPQSEEVEQASSDGGTSSGSTEADESTEAAKGTSTAAAASSTADEETTVVGTTSSEEDPEPDYYKKNSDNQITITAELEQPDGELKVADPSTLVEAPRVEDPYDQYDTIGDGVNYLVTIPKRLGFIEKDDGSYESDSYFTVWSNLNDYQVMTVKVTGEDSDNVILRDHRGTGEAVREVYPYMVDLNWDATKSFGDRISTAGSEVSIIGAGEFTARTKLVATDGGEIGSGRWAGPMVFSVDISPGLTEEQQADAAQYAAEHPEYE